MTQLVPHRLADVVQFLSHALSSVTQAPELLKRVKPEYTEEMRRYFPTNVLITRFDIIFFWVARMVMAGPPAPAVWARSPSR